MGSGVMSKPKLCPSKFEDVLKEYKHNDAVYKKVMKMLDEEIDRGLKKNAKSTLKMLVTFMTDSPTGKEVGEFLALDLGGTNFRVLLVKLKGSSFEMLNDIYEIGEELMTGPGTELFDYIASSISDFVKKHELEGDSFPLGFTFSFPCRQESLTTAKLITWTKGFTCDGVVEEDVVKLLQEAINRNEEVAGKVGVVAVLNDTVGCLMSCAYHEPSARIGVIIGTGTNACYFEKLDRVQNIENTAACPGSGQMVMNTEWGAFGDDGALNFIRTQIDKNVDSVSNNEGRQTFEKMISGMFLGELVRRVILKCIDFRFLFGGRRTPRLETTNSIPTTILSDIESDPIGGNYKVTSGILSALGVKDPSKVDCERVQNICLTLSSRAAYLTSAGIACLVNRVMETPGETTVGVDGSLFRFHPHFKANMITMTNKLTKPGVKVKLMLSEDGSGKGAALVAAVASKQMQCGDAPAPAAAEPAEEE